jgi:hypothetical protein
MKPKHATLLFAAVVCLFLLQRGGLILYGYSHISHPGIDEPVSGVLPCDILDGQIRGPLFAYEYLNRSGDYLLEGLLMVPYFKVLGRSIYSIKVFALSSALISLLCWMVFIKRYQGIWAALVFGMLFVFPPPMLSRLNLIGTTSSHHLLNPLIALQSLLLFRIIEQGKGKKVSIWLWIGSGLVAGLGVYTFYTYIIYIFFCALFLMIFPQPKDRLREIVFFIGAFVVGFSPWIFRSFTSHAGRQFLSSMLKNLSIDWLPFVQNFCFAVPHSFGYNYPSRAIGYLSPLFYLFIIFSACIILRKSLSAVFQKGTSLKQRFENLSLSYTQGLFCTLFPVFFLICLSLSPMRIMPFEYWPSVGLFATFNAADAIRYRWLYILFPFYFAMIAVGMTIYFFNNKNNRFSRLIICFAVLFFIVCGIWKTATLYSMKDFGKIFYYKGFNYDQFAQRFIAGDFVPHDMGTAQRTTRNYPETNRGEAYKAYGTLLAEKAVSSNDSLSELGKALKELPAAYMGDVIYGIVLAAQNLPMQKLQPLKSFLIQKYPDFFYENWGFRYLGYKYYGMLVNQEVLFANIPVTEQWFYKNFLEKFRHEIADYPVDGKETDLLAEVREIPPQYQPEVVKGLGMLVGAEMLFDTLYTPDYPLDSRFGEQLSTPLREAFYEGVGSGFAETLCRFWRMLLLPANTDSPLYEKLLDIEWNRCNDLMSRFAAPYYPIIKRGFLKNLSGRQVSPGIKRYIDKKVLS